MAYRVGMRKGLNIGRVVSKIGLTVLALWVGGYFLDELGNTMLGYCSPFFKGLTLIGWQVGDNTTAIAFQSDWTTNADLSCTNADTSNLILYDTSNAGILTVVGLIGIASIVMEFVQFRMG